jgi:hypothetical protein
LIKIQKGKEMTENLKLGIRMDHSNAHLIEFNKNTIELTTIDSEFTHKVKEDTLKKSERIMHNKEQKQQSEYYHKIRNLMLNYDNVLLFGPTEAKTELFNLCKADQRFIKTKIDIEQTDKMTENQEHAFVREYFSRI